MGDPGRGRGTGQRGGRVPGGVVRRQEPHKVEAAGVEGGGAAGPHHQHLLGVVVEGGDAGRHADGEGKPGHAAGHKEQQITSTCSACCSSADVLAQKVNTCVRTSVY